MCVHKPPRLYACACCPGHWIEYASIRLPLVHLRNDDVEMDSDRGCGGAPNRSPNHEQHEALLAEFAALGAELTKSAHNHAGGYLGPG